MHASLMCALMRATSCAGLLALGFLARSSSAQTQCVEKVLLQTQFTNGVAQPDAAWNSEFRAVDFASSEQALKRANELGVLGATAVNTDAGVVATVDSLSKHAAKALLLTNEGNSNAKRGRKDSKIAFIFLLNHEMNNEGVWDDFFAKAGQAKYSIYVHRGRPFGLVYPLRKWGAKNVPQVWSQHCALTGIEVAVLTEAMADPANEQFVLISHDAIPVKPFNYVYSQLTARAEPTSKICYFTHKGWDGHDETVQKHHQWVILNRRHAATFLGNVLPALEKVYPVHAQFQDGCSDETAVSAALLLEEASVKPLDSIAKDPKSLSALLTEMGVEQACTTWVYWGHDYFNNTALDLQGITEMPKSRPPFHFGQDIPIKAEYLSRLVNDGFLFARKFENESKVDAGGNKVSLRDLLPSLWELVDSKKASSRVWSRLDAYGQPGQR